MFPQQTKDALYHLSTAVMVGLFGGVGAIVLRQLIGFAQHTFRSIPSILPYEVYGINPIYIILPAIGGLITAPIVIRFAQEAKGHGIPEVMEAVNVYGGRIRGRVAFVKAITSAITIGSGGSAGREGPIAQIGASIGSMMGQRLGVGERQTRLLAACGLASGIGATFNAPLGGAIFAMEILLAEFDAISATSIILASVVGTAFAVYLPIPGLESFALGAMPAFNASGLMFNHPLELFFYLFMGLTMGLISIAWIKTFYGIEGFFTKLGIPQALKPALGGLLTGCIGVFLLGYGIMGSGYEGIDLALLGKLPLYLLILLGASKMLATSATVGSGGSGGVFAPTLFIGCMFGGAMGVLFNQAAPGIAITPMTYALVGMGALIAGSAKAPLTFIIMIPEMVGDWTLLAPIMMACVTSYLISSLFTKESIYTLKLMQRGVAIDVDHVLSDIHVEDFMSRGIDSVPADMRVSGLIEYMLRLGHTGYPVLDGDRLVGIVTFDDLQGSEIDAVVSELCTKEVYTLNPKDSAQTAVRMLYEKDVGRLVVVDEKDPLKVVGIVSRSDIIKAYHRMLGVKKQW